MINKYIPLLFGLQFLECNYIGASELYINLGNILFKNSEYKIAIQYLQNGLNFLVSNSEKKSEKNIKSICIGNLYLLRCYLHLDDIKKSKYIAKQMERFLNKNNKLLSDYLLIQNYESLSQYYYRVNNYSKSLVNIDKAIVKIKIENNKNISLYSRLLNQKIQINIKLNNLYESLTTCEQLVNSLKEYEYYYEMSKVYYSAFRICKQLNDIEYSQKAIMKCYDCLKIVLQKNNLSINQSQTEVASIIIDKVKYPYKHYHCGGLYYDLARTAFELKKYEISIITGNVSEKIWDQIIKRDSGLLCALYYLLALSYEKVGNQKKCNEYIDKYNKLNHI